MAYDKLVDSTQLDADLTAIANAIRVKSGGSGNLAFPAGFVSEIGNISGGGGEIISGSFVFAENTASATISIGQEFNRILLWAEDAWTGLDVKSTGLLFCDISDSPTSYLGIYGSTNNSGSSMAIYRTTNISSGTGGSMYSILNNCRATFYPGDRAVFTGSTSGTCFGYFPAGVNYRWIAW